MNQDEAIKNYVFSKTNIQMIYASLEEISVNKIDTEANLDLHNEISFGKRMGIKDGNKIEAFLKVVIESKVSWDGPAAIVMKIVYKGIFRSEKDIHEEELEKFADIQVVPQLLPYVRSMASSLSSQMMIEPIVLPTMDIIQSIVENSSEEKLNDSYGESD